MPSSFPRRNITPDWVHHQSRVLLPLETPPKIQSLPALPSPPRRPAFDAPYTLSTHIIPSAHPRTSPDVPPQKLPPNSIEKGERKRQLGEIRDEIMEMHEDVVTGKYGDRNKKVFWNCVNRYVRNGVNADGRKSKGVTLFLAHANGFPKEIWEVTLRYLLSNQSTCELVDEIWSWEAVQHGDSGLLNANNLGGIYDWSDNSRDILNFLLHYIPTELSSGPLPTHLEKVTNPESAYRKVYGLPNRKLVALAHSFGGCTTLLAALNVPSLFAAIMPIDPVVVRPRHYHGVQRIEPLLFGALTRREHWPSRAEARRIFSANPFFAAWHPEVLNIYIECALTEDPDGSVRLKMPGLQEANVFVESRTPYEVFTQLPNLDKKIKLRWLMPGKTFGIVGKANAEILVWRRPENSSNVLIPNSGHLIVHEAPEAAAEEIRNFIGGLTDVKSKL